MTRRRFSEKDVIRTPLHQGVEIRDYRTREPITLENVDRIEREHLHEVELGGPDEPENCRYSLKESHAIVTNGAGATTAGSSKGRIAKAKRIERTGKMEVQKLPPGDPRATNGRPIPSRPLRSRTTFPERLHAWPPRGSRPINKPRRA